VDVRLTDAPTLSVVIVTALIDSINPCAIGVLVILLSTLLHMKHNKNRMLTIGLIYIGAVFATYLAAGFGLLLVIQRLQISHILSVIVGSVIIILGLVEFRDAFAKKPILAISAKHASKISTMLSKVSIPSSIVLGMFVAAVELPCTGGPYLAITAILAQVGMSFTVVSLLVLYNFIFVLPLLIILGLVYFGVSTKVISKWKDSNKQWMRIANGILLIALGLLLLFWSQFMSLF